MILNTGREQTVTEMDLGLYDDNEPTRMPVMEHEVPDHDPHCVKCGRHVPHGVYRKLVERYYFLGFAVRTKTRWVQFYCINCLHEIDPKEYPYTVREPDPEDLTGYERKLWQK